MYTNILKQAQLPEHEITVYTLLLEHGPHTATQISEKTELKRGNTYYVLEKLEEKQLVEKTKKGKKTFFTTTHPQKLEEYIGEQEKELAQARKTIQSALPQLTADYNLNNNKPGVYFFEGREGLRKVFEDIYAPGKESVIGCVELEKVDEVLPDSLAKSIIPSRKKSKIHSNAFFIDSPLARKLKTTDEKDNRSTKLVDGDKYPMPAEIDVYENKMAFLSFEKGGFIGVIIENEALATTLKSVFQLAWDNHEDEA